MAKLKLTYYSRQQIEQKILEILNSLDATIHTVHPNSFFGQTYKTRRAKYLEYLDILARGEKLSNFVLTKLFHKGARQDEQ